MRLAWQEPLARFRRTRELVPADSAGWRALGGEVLAGAVASLVTLAHCLSFSALIFAGDLKSGLAFGLWGFLIATAAAGVVTSLATTLPPVLAGPRNPAVAVMSVMAATISADILAAGGSPENAAGHVLLGLAIATVLTGLALWSLGAFRLGQIVRFVPYPVIAGFLAASGWLLITGGLRLATGKPLEFSGMTALTPVEFIKLGAALAFVASVYALRRLGGGSAMLPVLFVGMALGIDLALWVTGARQGWFLEGASGARFWSPVGLAVTGDADWRVLARAGVEILSIVGVSVIALLLDVSSLEVQRARSADMDREFASNGAVNLVLAPLGGLPVGIALNPSRLIDELGGKSRAAGIAGSLAIALVLISGLDIAALVPTPVLAGLVIYLGLGVMSEALLKSPAGRSWLEIALALAIMLAIVRFGYLTGVILGLVGACILFAVRYSRIDAIRRHVTRAVFAAPVERAPEIKALLEAEGRRIHVFWLTGFIFFGSSNRIYEEIRAKVGALPARRRRWVVLDLGGVSGIDSSAVLSFVKLSHWAAASNVVVALAGPSAALSAEFAGADLGIGEGGVQVFATRSEALEWCEEGLIAQARLGTPEEGPDAFGEWLARELGAAAAAELTGRYLERRDLEAGETLCVQGAASDTIDLVASGSVAVAFVDEAGREIKVRRMAGRTVVGEMGFFRDRARTATVRAERATVLYVMTRACYDAMSTENPALGTLFLEFIVRALSDRVEFANAEIAALI